MQPVALFVHVLKVLEAEVVLTVRAEDLRLLLGAGGAQAAARGLEEGVVLAWAQGYLVQRISASPAEGHHTLVALQHGLHDAARLARDLQVPELLVEEHVRLLEEQAVHGGHCPQTQEVEALPLQNLQVPLSQRVLDGVVVVDRVMEVDDPGLADLQLRVRRHWRSKHLPRDPGELGLERQVDAQIRHKLHRSELILPTGDLQRPAALGFLEELQGVPVDPLANALTLIAYEDWPVHPPQLG
mmetsp:Transcript_29779/g.67452  ORF Transcript_29779/g.67452 Transcript_29779/m.67452 type:complete len:242 (+) Transcript_29779:1137-1862(+)